MAPSVRKRAAKGSDTKKADVKSKGVQEYALIKPAPRVEDRISDAAAEAALEHVFKDLPEHELNGLQLNCGMPSWLVGRAVGLEHSLRKIVLALISALVLPIELPILWLLRKVPALWVHTLCVYAFAGAMWVWRRLPKSMTNVGVAPDMSPEAHLMSLVMWPARLFPMTMRRMRFGMSNLEWFMPPPREAVKEDLIDLPERGVRGIWLHTAPKDVEDPPVFMWVFGGAFFAGDMEGNRGFAARWAKQLGADAFVIDYRLLPENNIAEAFLDGTRAYEYVCSRKSADKILVGGISAGAGLLVNAMQCAKSTDPKIRKWAFYGTDPTPQPAAALLIGPFVDFTIPESPNAAIVKNCAMDFIVTQRVLELCAAKFYQGEGSQERLRGLSPLFKDLSGLCPMHLNYSQCEATTDMCNELADKLKAAGNDLDVWTTPYLGHVFQVMVNFLPEAQASEKAAVAFLRKYLPKKAGNK